MVKIKDEFLLKIQRENRMMIYNKRMSVTNEINATDHLTDPEKFVFTGYEMDIRPNNDNSYYLKNPSES